MAAALRPHALSAAGLPQPSVPYRPHTSAPGAQGSGVGGSPHEGSGARASSAKPPSPGLLTPDLGARCTPPPALTLALLRSCLESLCSSGLQHAHRLSGDGNDVTQAEQWI